MDEEDLTESEAMLSDMAGEIEIHFNPLQSDDMPMTSIPKTKRCTKVKWSKKKASFLSSPIRKEEKQVCETKFNQSYSCTRWYLKS